MVTPPDLTRAERRLYAYVLHLHVCAGYSPTVLYLAGGARRPGVIRARVDRLTAAGLIARTRRGGVSPVPPIGACPWH